MRKCQKSVYHSYIWQDCDISYVVGIPTHTRFLLILQISYCLYTFIIIKYIVWYRNKPVVLLKRLKTDLCRSNFDFHQNLQKHKWNFLKIKYVLERYTSNNFLKCRLYVQIPMSWSQNYCQSDQITLNHYVRPL